MLSPNAVLNKYWGHSRLHPEQEEAISHVMGKEDVITLMPTGGGKSICFQVPALLQEGVCVVISPLISLMQDQVENLRSRGIKAMMLGGTHSFSELIQKLDNCLYGKYKFLYLSPERLQQEIVQERLRELKVSLVAIDEAHCISEWGHDFRPSYRNIPVLRELQPEVPFMALTATATADVLKDIQENLSLQKAKIIKRSFARKNINLLVNETEDKNYELQKFLKKNPGVGIVYVRSRKLTHKLKNFLSHHGILAEAYHGGMKADQKKKLLQDWQEEQFEVMIATNAFGMGIDKANVRTIVHYHLPDSLENYYQEIGRAGRDGLASKALLLYDTADILRLKDQFLTNAPTAEKTKFIYKKLNNYFSIAYGEGQDEQHNFNFLDFCHTYQLNTYLTYNVFLFLDQLDILNLSREFHQRTEIYFKISNRDLFGFLAENPKFKALIHGLLRMQGGFFSYKTAIDIKILQHNTGLNINQINTLLKELKRMEVIDLTLADQDSTIHFLVPREDDYTVNPLIPYLKKYYKNKKNKIDEVVRYIRNEKVCKMKLLLAYFDEAIEEDCKNCSVCFKKYRISNTSSIGKKQLRNLIRAALSEQALTSRQLIAKLDSPEESTLVVLRQMLDNDEIRLSDKNTYSYNK